jgi:integrase
MVSELTYRYAGRRTTPHRFRDIIAYTWLQEHPSDYLSLSKLLWHRNVNTTIQIYGARFNESSGVVAMESWLQERNGATK